MKLVSHDGIGELSQELFEESSNLHWCFGIEINCILPFCVNGLCHFFEAANVAVFAEDALHRHVHCAHGRHGILNKCRDSQSARPNAIGRLSTFSLNKLLKGCTKCQCFFIALASRLITLGFFDLWLVALLECLAKFAPECWFPHLNEVEEFFLVEQPVQERLH